MGKIGAFQAEEDQGRATAKRRTNPAVSVDRKNGSTSTISIGISPSMTL
jgi:hypothetical protein